MPVRAPSGLGLYFYKVPTERAASVAARLSGHGVRWAAICGPWHDGGQTKLVNTPTKLAAFSDALASDGHWPVIARWAGRFG